MTFQIGNTKNIPFHLVSATVVLVNATFSDGTVISVDQRILDNNQTYDTTHRISAEFKIPSAPSNATMTQAWIAITLNVSEISIPIQLPFSTAGCSI